MVCLVGDEAAEHPVTEIRRTEMSRGRFDQNLGAVLKAPVAVLDQAVGEEEQGSAL